MSNITIGDDGRPVVSGRAVFVGGDYVVEASTHTFVSCDKEPSCTDLCHWQNAQTVQICGADLAEHQEAGTA